MDAKSRILCDTIADSDQFGVVYFCDKISANTVSYKAAEEILSINPVKDDKDRTTGFLAESRIDGTKYLFKSWSSGLYVYEGKHSVDEVRAYVSLVSQRKKMFTKKEIKGAEKAMLLRQRVGYPGVQEFKKMTVAGTVSDLDISTKDVNSMESILGKEYVDAAGKGVYRPTKVPTPEKIVDIAAEFVEKMKQQPLTLHADIFFVDRVAFLLTVSKPLNYVIVTHLKDRKWTTILENLETHKNVYKKYNWNAKYLKFDREKGVSCLKNVLATKLDLHLDQSAPYQKVPAAERKVRLVKERMRCEICNLGFKMNRTFLVYLPQYVCRRLSICTSSIIGVNISPTEMLTDNKVSAKTELKTSFGEYSTVIYKNTAATNSMAPRARCGICLGLSSSSEASGIFYDISKPLSQEPLVADNYTPTPVPEPVVEYLNNLAEVRPMNFDEQNMSILQPYKDDMQPEPPVEVDPEQYTNTSKC